MALTVYDFTIVAKGRSGSHMLASYLNSHSDLRCEGEYGKEDKKVQPSESGRFLGTIVMYNVLPKLLEMHPIPKVIHLKRDPTTNAISFVRQIIRYRMRRKGHPTSELPGKEFRLDGSELEYWSNRIAEEQKRVTETLDCRGFKVLNLCYEDLLDSDCVARAMPIEQSELICEFLEVGSLPMQCSINVEFGTTIPEEEE